MGGGGVIALEAIGLLTQDAEPGGTTLVDAHNIFHELIRLEILWMVCLHWPAEARFAFNCYRHGAQSLLYQPGNTLVILLIQEGVTQGDPLLIVLYGILPSPP